MPTSAFKMSSTTNATNVITTNNKKNTKAPKNATSFSQQSPKNNVGQKKGIPSNTKQNHSNNSNNSNAVPTNNVKNRNQSNSRPAFTPDRIPIVNTVARPTEQRLNKLKFHESSVLMRFLNTLVSNYGDNYRNILDSNLWIQLLNNARVEYEESILSGTGDENNISLSVAENILYIQNSMVYPDLSGLFTITYPEIREMIHSKEENKFIPVWQNRIVTGFTLRDILTSMNINHIVEENRTIADELASFINFVLPERQFGLVTLREYENGEKDTGKLYLEYEAEIVAHLIFIFFEKTEFISPEYQLMYAKNSTKSVIDALRINNNSIPDITSDNDTFKKFQTFLKGKMDKSAFDNKHSNPNNTNTGMIFDGLFLMAFHRYFMDFLTLENYSNESVTNSTATSINDV